MDSKLSIHRCGPGPCRDCQLASANKQIERLRMKYDALELRHNEGLKAHENFYQERGQEIERLTKELGIATREYHLKAQSYGVRIVTAHAQRAYLEDGDWIVPEPVGPLVPSFAAYPVKPEIFDRNYVKSDEAD